MAEVYKCTCQHEWQDMYYGKYLRLMNATSTGWKCTVCGKEYRSGDVKKG